ncbi:hypothetical protein T492DRAFT_1036828 [Pavlovales sp. CCMP2436]|nr:hypothetical protein T492DRAFT_1036828 [Pavlovales sp. CCMP2436]
MAGVARVAIVGGGIGGLALARALGRAGLDAHIYEQAASFSSSAGAGFILQPNGAACLQAIGLSRSEVEKLVHPLRTVTLLGAGGRVVGSSSAFGEISEQFAQPLGGVLRAELVDMLARPLVEQQRISYSCNVASVRQTSDGVTATLSTGEEILADILIGADGVHSITAGAIDSAREELRRESPLPPMLRFHPAPLGSNATERERVFYGVILDLERPFAHPHLGLPHHLLEDLSHGEFISYGLGLGRDQNAEGGGPCRALMWMQTVRVPGGHDATEEWAAARDPAKATEALNHFLSRAPFAPGHPIFEAAARTAPSRARSFSISARALRDPDAWHHGRICLLGDAAHSTLPYTAQGLNMAIEDALVLSECLAGPSAHVEEAFEAYTRRRHARTTSCAAQAEANAALLRSRSATLDRWRDSLLGAVVSGGLLQRTLAAQIEGGPVPLGPAAVDDRK